jgi:ArsR family transcriptional regulator, arsenate/arsenite/antimonite-responsive transcriptional repressor
VTTLGAIDLMFRGFADPTRLRILHLLRHEGETCVGDLVASLRLSQPTASRHLAYLRRAGLVEARKDGLWSHYSLSRPRTAAHRTLLECLGGCFAAVPELRADRKRSRSVRTKGGCCP